MATIKQSLYRFGAIAAVVGVVVSPVVASAATNTANTTINAVVSPTISLSTLGTVSLPITSTGVSMLSVDKDTVTVVTNNSTGFDLTLADQDAATTLVSGANTITASAGTQAAPTTGLVADTWGYRVDSIGGFGAGPSATVTNSTTDSALKWAGVPATGSPNNIRSTSTTTAGDATNVWYGVRVSAAKPSGTYSDIVTYSATTKP